MAFNKAPRFNPDKVSGPPTAYNPQQSGEIGMTRSHSSNSVGLTNSSTSTIQNMQAKRDFYKDLLVEKRKLENKCDKAIADLKAKEIEVSSMARKLDELKIAFESEKTLCHEFALALEREAEMKKVMESQLSELFKKNENLENVTATQQERVQQLEINLQQLVAERDEYSRQFDHHQEEMTQLLTSRDELQVQHDRLRQDLERIGGSLETKVNEVETLKTQLEVPNEKLKTKQGAVKKATHSFEPLKPLDGEIDDSASPNLKNRRSPRLEARRKQAEKK